MRQRKIALRNLAVLITLIFGFIACDTDFANLDSDLTDDSIRNFRTDSRDIPVVAYTQPISVVQTSNVTGNQLSSALFGYYNDPILGNSTFNLISALTPATLSPAFGTEVELDSVTFTLPLFSTQTDVDESGLPVYRLDSVYNPSQPIDIAVYRSNYFLRDRDPNSSLNSSQRFYANQSDGVNPISDTQLENRLLFTIENFKPSNKRIKLINEFDGRDSTFVNPSLRYTIDAMDEGGAVELDYWKSVILDREDTGELNDVASFRNYFRGIYIKASAKNGLGNAFLIDLAAGGSITLHYTREITAGESERQQGSYVMNLNGRQATFIQNEFTIDQGDMVQGDERLILKGGAGSVAVIDLFEGTDIDDDGLDNAFEAFKKEFVNTDEDGNFISSRKLINEANLVFYVDQDALASLDEEMEPEQLILYDLENGRPLQDFFRSPVGQLQREGENENGKGIRYKLKLTEHINNLLLNDSTNVKLGLAILGNALTETTTAQLNVIISGDENLSLPASSLVNPRSTVLFGNNVADENKKLYLELFFTDIEQQP